MKKILKLLSCLKSLMLYVIAWTVAKIAYRGQNIWLFCERGDEARDNALFLFNYVTKNYPEIDARFVIAQNSTDVKKIHGPVVFYQSFKHYVLFFAAKLLISTHVKGGYPGYFFYGLLWERMKFDVAKKKKVFLQHGVIKDDIKYLYKENAPVDLFICGAKPEYDFVKRTFHYNENEIKYTGLARFDSLHDFVTKRQILVMPTWRWWLSPTNGMVMGSARLKQTPYFRCWNSFLSNKDLHDLLNRYDLQLIFYPHYEMQRYLHLFEHECSRISIAGFDYDVQTLLKESVLLVTDFSSVFFVFEYMRKPVIYYQFDEDEYRCGHYQEGYFDYRKNGFGPVFVDEDDLVNEIKKMAQENFEMAPIYKERAKSFFPLYDKCNCERIFSALQQLV